jgi:bacteriocin biosynthesis cyclodehydratase domain-containing protein
MTMSTPAAAEAVGAAAVAAVAGAATSPSSDRRSMTISPEGSRAGVPPVRPLLKPWYRISRAGGAVVFSYGRSIVEIRGPRVEELIQGLLPLLDGNHGIDEILTRFQPDDRQSLIDTIELMSRRELLLDGPLDARSPRSMHASTFLQAAAGSAAHPSAAARAIESAYVGIVGPSRTASVIGELLSDSGVHVIAMDSDSQLPSLVDQLTVLIVAPASLNHARLSAINLHCLETRTTWVPVLPFDGEFAVVGPIVVPWVTCCYECFERRRDANSAAPGIKGTSIADDAVLPSTSCIEHVLAGLCALTVLRWVCDPRVAGPGSALTVQAGADISVNVHRVYRVPRCPVCSDRHGANRSSQP